jgi:predicted esterase
MMSTVTIQLGFVHRFVPAQDSNATTLLLLHGTGGDETDMLPLGQSLMPEAALLSPRGKVLENGMNRFFRRLAEGVFDVEDLKSRTHQLAEFIGEASETYHLDASRIVAAGFSNGANIAASLLLLHPGLLRAAILFCPMVPLVPESLPDLAGTSVFVGAGRADHIVRPEETERLAVLLQNSGADVTVRWHNRGHTISNDQLAAAQTWLARVNGE